MGWKIHSHTQGSLSLNVAFPSSPVAGKYHWHLMGSRGRRRRGEEQEPKLFYGNTDGCLLWQNASSTTLPRSSLEPLASTGGESPTYSQGGLPSHPDICLISSLSALLTHHAGCCQRSPDDNSSRRSPRSLATVIFGLSFLAYTPECLGSAVLFTYRVFGTGFFVRVTAGPLQTPLVPYARSDSFLH